MGYDFGPGYENIGQFVSPPIEETIGKGLR